MGGGIAGRDRAYRGIRHRAVAVGDGRVAADVLVADQLALDRRRVCAHRRRLGLAHTTTRYLRGE